MDHQAHRATGNPLWHEHLERMRALRARPASARAGTRRIVVSSSEAEEARGGEWTATPPGRLGRRLLAEIEPYLEFFALARAS